MRIIRIDSDGPSDAVDDPWPPSFASSSPTRASSFFTNSRNESTESSFKGAIVREGRGREGIKEAEEKGGDRAPSPDALELRMEGKQERSELERLRETAVKL